MFDLSILGQLIDIYPDGIETTVGWKPSFLYAVSDGGELEEKRFDKSVPSSYIWRRRVFSSPALNCVAKHTDRLHLVLTSRKAHGTSAISLAKNIARVAYAASGEEGDSYVCLTSDMWKPLVGADTSSVSIVYDEDGTTGIAPRYSTDDIKGNKGDTIPEWHGKIGEKLARSILAFNEKKLRRDCFLSLQRAIISIFGVSKYWHDISCMASVLNTISYGYITFDFDKCEDDASTAENFMKMCTIDIPENLESDIAELERKYSGIASQVKDIAAIWEASLYDVCISIDGRRMLDLIEEDPSIMMELGEWIGAKARVNAYANHIPVDDIIGETKTRREYDASLPF